MRAVFCFMVVLSMVALMWGGRETLRATAHQHTDDRERTLSGLQEPVYVGDHRNGYFGVTRDELSKCDEAVAQAYEASIREASRLGTGYDRMETGFNVLAVLQLIAGVLGLRAIDAKALPPRIDEGS